MKTRLLIFPWCVSTVVSSIFVLALLLFSVTLPEVWLSIVGPERMRVFPFGMSEPLTRTSLVFTVLTVSVYWGLGLVLGKSNFEKFPSRRAQASYICLTLAIAGIFLVIPMLVVIWLLAIKGGHIPMDSWGIYEGNHGPWRHVYDLRELLSYTIFIPLGSFLFGMTSLLFKRSILAVILVLACVLGFFGLLHSHYWLID
jgi:hypothetical protein